MCTVIHSNFQIVWLSGVLALYYNKFSQYHLEGAIISSRKEYLRFILICKEEDIVVFMRGTIISLTCIVLLLGAVIDSTSSTSSSSGCYTSPSLDVNVYEVIMCVLNGKTTPNTCKNTRKQNDMTIISNNQSVSSEKLSYISPTLPWVHFSSLWYCTLLLNTT